MKNQKIIPSLWFDNQAGEAAEYYVSLFGEKSSIHRKTYYTEAGKETHGRAAGSVMTVEFEIADFKFVALNGGPHFKFTPAISFYVTCETEEEVDKLWNEFDKEGEVMMPLDKYDWSKKYGWIKDKFGLTWQISLGKLSDVGGQKIVPLLMYVTEKGEAEEAMKLYTSLFEDSDSMGVLRYGAGEEQPEGLVKHAQFKLNGEVFMVMDSSPNYADFTFNEAISLMINCENQQEIDHFWKLSAHPSAEQCGWLKDKFGLSWQVVPAALDDMLQDKDQEKVKRVTQAFLKMKKLNIDELYKAYESK